MAERGVEIDHAALNRWVVKYASLIAQQARAKKRPGGSSWRMDETDIKVIGKRTYLYRAIDKFRNTFDFMLSVRRDGAATKRFFRRAIVSNGVLEKVVIDNSGSNLLGLKWANYRLVVQGRC
jgi:putative transposase